MAEKHPKDWGTKKEGPQCTVNCPLTRAHGSEGSRPTQKVGKYRRAGQAPGGVGRHSSRFRSFSAHRRLGNENDKEKRSTTASYAERKSNTWAATI